jgi:hypothetical protein
VSSWPQVLVLDIKRHQWDKDNNNHVLNTAAFTVPLTLDEIVPGHLLIGTLVCWVVELLLIIIILTFFFLPS